MLVVNEREECAVVVHQPFGPLTTHHCAIGAECLVVLVVNEREEGAVVVHLPFGPLTTHHCAIGAECLVVCVSC